MSKGRIVTTKFQLYRLARRMEEASEIAFDTETNTTDWCNADNPYFKIVGISICFGEYDRYYIPIGHIYDPTPQLPIEVVVEKLRPAFERKDVRIIGHNLKYDAHVLARVGIRIQTEDLFDTMIASWMIDENELNGLKPNVLRYFNYKMETYDETVAKVSKETKKRAGLKPNQKATFDLTMIGDSADYATEDAYYTWRLYLLFIDKLSELNLEKVYYKMYPPYLRLLFEMEEQGITLDTKRCDEMDAEMQKDLDELHYEMLEIVGVPFDIASSQQLCQLLYGYDEFKTVNPALLEVNYGFKPLSYTAKGVPQVNNTALEKIATLEFKNKHKREGVEFVRLLIEWKKLQKLQTFTAKFKDVCYPDGKIHCTFNPIGTTSGRASCSNPNLQQLPNADEEDKYQIRSLFKGDITPTGQEDIISCDYSNLEVRVMAHFSKDKGLLDAFAHKVDLHGNTAKLMFRLDCDANEVKKKYPKFRQMGKVIAFLLQYGGSVMALEQTLNEKGMLSNMLQEMKQYKSKKELPDTLVPFWGCKNTKEMAQSLMNLYFEAFPGIAKFMKQQKKKAHKYGYVQTVLGRVRHLPMIYSKDYGEVGYAERLALNAPIQGSGADIMINAQINIARNERLRELDCKMLVQIHDELLFSCPHENCEEAIKVIRECMIYPFGRNKLLNLALDIGAGFGESYQCGH